MHIGSLALFIDLFPVETGTPIYCYTSHKVDTVTCNVSDPLHFVSFQHIWFDPCFTRNINLF